MNPIVVSKTKQIFNGKPYYLCGKYFQNDGERLHRVVYAYHHGPIPKGMAVHHKDEDRSNNGIDNLMLMAAGEHTRHHHAGKEKTMPAETLLAAAEWHGSEEGREWHKDHYQNVKHKMRQKVVIVCEECGKSAEVTYVGVNRFCGKNCKANYRRKSGIDNETRKCEYCLSLFEVNKYKPNRFCCRVCSAMYNAEKRA